MPKYQSSGKYRSKQRYNRSQRDTYRTLQNLYRRIEQLQKYRSAGSSSFGSYGFRPRMMRYQPEPERRQYTREKPQPKYIVKSETPTYRIEPPRQINTEQLVEETENRIESKLKPLIEGIERKLDTNASTGNELEHLEIEKPHASLDEIRKHALELREFADRDWDGSREDLEFLWTMRNLAQIAIEGRADTDEDTIEPTIESHAIEHQQAEPDTFRGTELSTEVNLSAQRESPVDEMDFFALESELFGIEYEMEAEVEDQSEVG